MELIGSIHCDIPFVMRNIYLPLSLPHHIPILKDSNAFAISLKFMGTGDHQVSRSLICVLFDKKKSLRRRAQNRHIRKDTLVGSDTRDQK